MAPRHLYRDVVFNLGSVHAGVPRIHTKLQLIIKYEVSQFSHSTFGHETGVPSK
jgi:hypothetical protein